HYISSLPSSSLYPRLCSLSFFFYQPAHHRALPSFPTRRSSDLGSERAATAVLAASNDATKTNRVDCTPTVMRAARPLCLSKTGRSEEHTSELQSLTNLVCRLLLEKKKKDKTELRKRQQSNKPAN